MIGLLPRKPSDGRIAWLMLTILMTLTAVVYWPALMGGYIFDDSIYFVDNPDIHVSTLHLADWIRAALSLTGTNQFRGLSALTLAVNFYFTGLDPFWVKLTNLTIHLLNGLVLFLMLRELLRLRGLARGASPPETAGARSGLLAASVAGLWLLLPINLTGVAYASQRMESLANLFVFCGLFWYFRVRRNLYAGKGSSTLLWLSLIVSSLVGYSAKESAVLLTLYTACAEFAVTRFRNCDDRYCRPALWAHVTLLIVPLIAGLLWISTWLFHGITNFRGFTTGERLLTEARVLADYIGWTLFPNLDSLTFFHDDLVVSHGLLDPPTTLLAIAGLAALLCAALWQRKTKPLFCLGILWFFAGHSMTATILPLELVFEHRNYFPSAGLLLAAASLVALEPGLPRIPLKIVITGCFLGLFSFTTFLRAQEWSHPLRFAYSEALKRPDSPRAQYELARVLVQAAGSDQNSPLIEESVTILERTAFRDESGIPPLQALIFVNGRAHRPIDAAWWRAIIAKIQARPLSQSDVDAIVFLFHCQSRGDCPRQTQELLDVFTAALTASHGNVFLMAAYSDFALTQLGDAPLAERMSRDVVAARPYVPVYRANLTRLLIVTRQYDDAEATIADLARMNHLGSLDTMISKLRDELAAARSAAPLSSKADAG